MGLELSGNGPLPTRPKAASSYIPVAAPRHVIEVELPPMPSEPPPIVTTYIRPAPTVSANNTLAATQWMGRPGKDFNRALVDPMKQPTQTQRHCAHVEWTNHANGHGVWKKCKECKLRLEYCDNKSGVVARYANFSGVCTVMSTSGHSKRAQKEVDDEGHVLIILDSGCKRSVAGPAWHAAMETACATNRS